MKTKLYLLSLLSFFLFSIFAKAEPKLEKVVLAGGCFWCMEKPFDELDGVISTTSGYAGGHKDNPTYEDVTSGTSGHVEAVEITFDSNKVSLEKILDVYWQQIDPTDAGGQFVDRGESYRPVIFYKGEQQKSIAEKSLVKLKSFGIYDKPIVVELLPFINFYPAEDDHQDFYKKNPTRYKFYRKGSGRDAYLGKTCTQFQNKNQEWRKQSMSEDLKNKLTPEQYRVTQQDGTEAPFQNKYWDHKEPGIYVDVVSGEALFSSTNKYDSGSGWPSFTQPIDNSHITEKTDYKLIVPRTEIRSKEANSHLGHVFEDGPGENGLRYCVNSASLRFIPVSKLEEEGYGEYLKLFKK